MRSQLIVICATTMGAAVLSISSLMIYQHLTSVQVVPQTTVVAPAPPVPVVEPVLPAAAAEPMATEPFTPAGRLPAMPRTGKE